MIKDIYRIFLFTVLFCSRHFPLCLPTFGQDHGPSFWALPCACPSLPKSWSKYISYFVALCHLCQDHDPSIFYIFYSPMPWVLPSASLSLPKSWSKYISYFVALCHLCQDHDPSIFYIFTLLCPGHCPLPPYLCPNHDPNIFPILYW
jgi:hypothetical protein